MGVLTVKIFAAAALLISVFGYFHPDGLAFPGFLIVTLPEKISPIVSSIGIIL